MIKLCLIFVFAACCSYAGKEAESKKFFEMIENVSSGAKTVSSLSHEEIKEFCTDAQSTSLALFSEKQKFIAMQIAGKLFVHQKIQENERDRILMYLASPSSDESHILDSGIYVNSDGKIDNVVRDHEWSQSFVMLTQPLEKATLMGFSRHVPTLAADAKSLAKRSLKHYERSQNLFIEHFSTKQVSLSARFGVVVAKYLNDTIAAFPAFILSEGKGFSYFPGCRGEGPCFIKVDDGREWRSSYLFFGSGDLDQKFFKEACATMHATESDIAEAYHQAQSLMNEILQGSRAPNGENYL